MGNKLNFENLDDDGKLYRKYYNKKVNALKENIGFYLTFDEYKQLMIKGGFKSSDLGFTGNNIVLARYGDNGDYTIDNCRFVTQLENVQEKKITEKSRIASINNITKLNKSRKGKKMSPEQLKKYHESDYYKRRQEQKRIHEKEKNEKKNPSYTKEHNSQYNTFWITNGVDNKKWKEEFGELPENYYKGRTIK